MLKLFVGMLLFIAFAPIILLFLICIGIISFIINFNKEQIYDIKQIDRSDGHAFENICANILRANNYTNVKVTRGSGDFGIDVLAKKNSIKFAIQCKHYSNNVGISAVQQALSGCLYYKCDIPVVLTNNYFTPQAIEMAKSTNVELWDRSTLLKLNKIKKERAHKQNKSMKHPLLKKIMYWLKNVIFILFVSPFFTLPNYTKLTSEEKYQTYLICLIVCSCCLISNILYIKQKHKNRKINTTEGTVENDTMERSNLDNDILNDIIDDPHDIIFEDNNEYQNINNHNFDNQYRNSDSTKINNIKAKEIEINEPFDADKYEPHFTTTLDEDLEQTYQSALFMIPEADSEEYE